MKKFFLYLLIFICIIFIVPSIFTKKRKTLANVSNQENQEIKKEEAINEEQQEVQQTEEETKYEYSKYATLKLYHSKTGEIEEVPLDEYLYGVVSAEMPADFEKEALKAQAIVARTYTLYQIINSKGKHQGADICDDSTCCQAWISKEDRLNRWEENLRETNWNKITNSVNTTKGKIITYEGKPIDAFFHSNSGGKTENCKNVWGGNDLPYLQSVETAGEEGYEQYSSEVDLSKDELVNKLKEKHKDMEINYNEDNAIQILEYTESGRVRTVKFGNTKIAGTEARTLLGLKSTNFTFEINENTVKFFVKGYGHGVGMSQTGADSMAKNGSNAEEIIKHFYTNVEVSYVNDL